MRRLGRSAGAFALAAMLAGCGTILPEATTPRPPAVPGLLPPATPGPVDVALQAIEPLEVLRAVEGGAACRPGSIPGSRGSGDRFHLVQDFVCPRAGDDRTVYFLFAEAYAAALEAAGATIGGSGGDVGDARGPIVTDWDVRGDASLGTARVAGVDNPGTLVLLVTLDLVIP